MQRRFKTGVIVLLVVACFVAACTMLFSISMFSSPQQDLSPEIMEPVDTGWTCVQDGEDVSFVPGEVMSCDGEEFTISREIAPSDADRNVLLFRNNRQGVLVSAGGEEIYSMGYGERSTKLSAMYYQVVRLPHASDPYELQIRFSSLQDGVCLTPHIYMGSSDEVLVFLGLKSIATVALIPIYLILAVVFVLIMIIMVIYRAHEHRLSCLTIFLLLFACWTIGDAAFSSLLPIDSEILSTVTYYMLMLMPLPTLVFITLSCNYRQPPFRNIALSLVIANVICQSALFLLGKASLFDMLAFSQALLLLSLVYGNVCMGLDYAKGHSKTSLLQLIALSITSFLGLMTIVMYWIGADDIYQIFFQSCMVAFLVGSFLIIVYSLLQRRSDERVMNAEINALKTIAVIDQLTGLANRRAFDQDLEVIQAQQDSHVNAILVFLDLNGLKYANDKLGHMAGDELLIAAARAISYAFSDVGTVYRIGGDEFAVLIRGSNVNLAEHYELMDEFTAKYNETSKTPLSIARGSSTLINAHGQRSSISDWKMHADKNMYKDKVQGRLLSASGTAQDYLEIISSFVSAVDAKDSYTADHSERVAVLSDLICGLLGLSESSTDQIRIAASLHDIGKIGIPDSILLKPGSLTRDEVEIIQTHTVIGEDIVKHTRAFYEVSQIIRHHHERFDGGGYPDGLVGNAIPLGSRIIAIADSIDAITSNRSYRSARSLTYCKQEISDNLGTFYDPAIGAIVLENWSKVETVVLSEPIFPVQ